MKCLFIGAFLLLFGSSASRAQQPEITPDMQVDDSTLHQWLHSDDPRLVAWAADFARRGGNSKIIGEMPDVLENAAMPPDYGRNSAQADPRPLDGMLDALIQSNATVPISTIRAVWHAFPAQAAILISRLPLSDSRQTLREWTYGNYGDLSRIALMLLANNPEPGLVEPVLRASEEAVFVTVRASDAKEPEMGMSSCGETGFGSAIQVGWPAVFIYLLKENSHQAGIEIVDLDGDRIGASRWQSNVGWRSCSDDVEQLDSLTRHRLIAHWLGVQEDKMAWQPAERFTIVWSGEAAYGQRLGEIVDGERGKLSATVQTLQNKGLLSGWDDPSLMPQLVVNIQCDIKPCPLK